MTNAYKKTHKLDQLPELDMLESNQSALSGSIDT